MSDTPSFSVVTVLKENLETSMEFVRWYKRLGAREIIMFFDDPNDPAIAKLADTEGVIAIGCDPAFWDSIGQFDGKKFVKRQNAALNHGYRMVTSDWVLAVDSDEKLYDAAGLLTHRLAGVAPECRAIRSESTEALKCVEPGTTKMFRTPMTSEQITDIYGEEAWLFRRRNGLVGHYQGKSIIRAGQQDIRLRQHWAEDHERNKIGDLMLTARDGIYLLHQIGADYAVWREKLEWRNEAWGFARYINQHMTELRQNNDEDGLEQLYRSLHEADAAKIAKMRSAGVLVELDAAEIEPVTETEQPSIFGLLFGKILGK